MTADLIAMRLELARQTLAAEAAQKAATKPVSRENWLPTVEEFAAHSDRLGYAVGSILWGQNRAAKEQRILESMATALGESLDEEAITAASAAVVQGFSRAYQQFRFPSPTMKKGQFIDPDKATEALYREFVAAYPDNILSRLIKLMET